MPQAKVANVVRRWRQNVVQVQFGKTDIAEQPKCGPDRLESFLDEMENCSIGDRGQRRSVESAFDKIRIFQEKIDGRSDCAKNEPKVERSQHK